MAGVSSILYVDDQPSHLALFKQAFGRDYNVMTSSSQQQGLEIIKDSEIFLILADHNMPGMTGIDFLEKAKEISPQSTRAILSAYLDEEIAKESQRRIQAAALLKKPWKLEPMRQFLSEAYHRYEIDRSVPPEISEIPSRPFHWKHCSEFLQSFEESVNFQGSRRIFLNYVEPRLRKFVPRICRPLPEILERACREALCGNLNGFEELLTRYLQERGEPSSPRVLLQ